jgi:hypothetical protein
MLPITLAAGLALCDAEAHLAGQLMALVQAGAARDRIEAAVEAQSDPAWAAWILPRVLHAETSEDPEARELAAYHFAAEAHARCTGTG